VPYIGGLDETEASLDRGSYSDGKWLNIQSMNEVVRRLVSKVVEKFAGSGVGIDDTGRLCLPDGLDTDRMHRFIELCLDESLDTPKAALDALFERVGIARVALAALDQIVGDQGDVDFQAIAHNPLKLSMAVPRLLEIPVRFQRFLIDDLGLADPTCVTLEEAVVSTREQAAERIGCKASWDEILTHPAEIDAIARSWRERSS
jgi:hypothetical protein